MVGTFLLTFVFVDVRVSVELPLPSGAGELAPAQFRSTILNSARRALEVARQELE